MCVGNIKKKRNKVIWTIYVDCSVVSIEMQNIIIVESLLFCSRSISVVFNDWFNERFVNEIQL